MEVIKLMIAIVHITIPIAAIAGIIFAGKGVFKLLSRLLNILETWVNKKS